MTWALWVVLTAIYFAGLYWMYRHGWHLRTFVWGSAGQVFLILQAALLLGTAGALAALEAQHLRSIMAVFGVKLQVIEDVLVLVPDDQGWTAMTIGVESSTLIEMSVFSGLILHYPSLSLRRRLASLAVGITLTYALNMLRLMVIVVMVVVMGRSAFVVAHTLVGRLIYFAGVVALYWYLLTKPTLARVQKSVAERDR